MHVRPGTAFPRPPGPDAERAALRAEGQHVSSRASMRVLSYAILLAAWAPILGSCLCPPKPQDWLAVGFRTPEQSFRTFQTALRADLPDLEWRTLSSGLKRQIGAQIGYRVYRAEVFEKAWWLKFAAKARIVETQELAPDRRRVVARVETLFHDETFAIDFAREDYYELWVDGELVQDDLVDWSRIADEEDGELAVRIPIPSGLAPDSSREVRAGHEWKIDDFPLAIDAAAP